MQRDPRLEIITEAIEGLVPRAVPTNLTITVTETLPGRGNPDGTPHKHQWTGGPDGLAQHIYTRLFGSPETRGQYAARLQAITETLRTPVEGVTPAYLINGAPLSYFEPGADPSARPRPWSMETGMLARRIYTALYGRPRAEEPRSPLAQAEDAKRARDLPGELGALMSAGAALESAPWYPCRPGDVVLLAYPAAGDFPAHGETYVVDDAGDGLMSLKLVSHSSPLATDEQEGYVGCYETAAADCPVNEMWFEAGPHLLTIVRDGRPVHIGGAR